jgi:tRNA pseudouridine55 synthase
MYSAVRVGGRRLYDIARRGDTVERKPRPVTLYSVELDRFDAEEMAISMRCSKGFFVRALVDEIGRAFNCGAHLTALRRTASASFTLQMALPLAELLVPGGRSLAEKQLIPTAAALGDLPAVQLSDDDAARVRNGARLRVAGQPGRVRLISKQGVLLALAEVSASQELRYLRVFREASS